MTASIMSSVTAPAGSPGAGERSSVMVIRMVLLTDQRYRAQPLSWWTLASHKPLYTPVEVAVVGRSAHLEHAPQVPDALAHGAPPPLAPAVTVGLEPQHPELTRVVDHRLDAQDRDLVVHLHPVRPHPMPHPPPLRAPLRVGHHLRRQGRVELAPEEPEDVFR